MSEPSAEKAALTDDERAMLRGLGQGQVVAVVERIVTARLLGAADAILAAAPPYGHETRERLKGRHESARVVRGLILPPEPERAGGAS